MQVTQVAMLQNYPQMVQKKCWKYGVFPGCVYNKTMFFTACFRFLKALQPLEKGLAVVVSKRSKDLKTYYWPQSSFPIDESKYEKLKVRIFYKTSDPSLHQGEKSF